MHAHMHTHMRMPRSRLIRSSTSPDLILPETHLPRAVTSYPDPDLDPYPEPEPGPGPEPEPEPEPDSE